MDMFGRQDQILMGGLSSDSMFVSWPELATVVGGSGGVGLLIQQIGLEYSQPVRRIYEIGPGVLPAGTFSSSTVSAAYAGCDTPTAPSVCQFRTVPTYYIVGRPEGQLQFGRFIGPNALTTCFYRKYGSPCSTNVMTISGKAGCSSTDPSGRKITWVISGVLLNKSSMDMDGREMVMQERLGAMFVGLNMLVQGDDGTCGATTTTLSTH